MFMTIVRVLLPKISWKHKEGAILRGASNVPQNCRMETTAFGNNIQEEVEGELQGQQRSSRDLWFLLGKKKKIKAQKSETQRKYIRIEKGGHYVSDQTLLLTAKMVNSCKSKDHQGGKKDRVNPIKMQIHIQKINYGLFLLPFLWRGSGSGLAWQESSCFFNTFIIVF